MFSKIWLQSALLLCLATSATVLSQQAPVKPASGTPVKEPASKDTTTPKPAPKEVTSQVSPAEKGNKNPSPATPGTTVTCSSGWAPVGDDPQQSPSATSGAEKPKASVGHRIRRAEQITSEKTNTTSEKTKPSPNKPKSTTDNAKAINENPKAGTGDPKASTDQKPKAANEKPKPTTNEKPKNQNNAHLSLCDTQKQRYKCPTQNCKPKGGQPFPQADKCKGKLSTSKCIAYRAGLPNGQISLSASTPHPESSQGWIECAAVHKVDKQGKSTQRIDTIACQSLTVPMVCTGCELQKDSKIKKTGEPLKAEPTPSGPPTNAPKPKTNQEPKPKQSETSKTTQPKPKEADAKTTPPKANSGDASKTTQPKPKEADASKTTPPKANAGDASKTDPPKQAEGDASKTSPPKPKEGDASKNGQQTKPQTTGTPKPQTTGPASKKPADPTSPPTTQEKPKPNDPSKSTTAA